MTDDAALAGRRSEMVVFRPEITDFGSFYERTYQASFRTALGIVRDASLAADVTQEAYVNAYRHRDRFKGDVPATAWLYRIVANAALSALRRGRPVLREMHMLDGAGPDAGGMTAERLTLLDALDALGPRQRAAVILRYYHDLDYATIAQILDTTSTNVGAMLSRALDRLRVELERADAPAAARTGR